MSELRGYVIYCDGAYKTKKGQYASYGLHGYGFTYEPAKVGTGDSKIIPTPVGYKQENIFTDIKYFSDKNTIIHETFSGLIPENMRVSKGTKQIDLDPNAKVSIQEYIDGYGSVHGEQTNNRGELLGFITALKLIKDKRESFENITALILCDSEYVIKGTHENLNKWKENNWQRRDGTPVKNLDLWKEVDSLVNEVLELNILLTVGWVEGHSQNVGNVRADQLANIGYNVIVNGEHDFNKLFTSPARGYWNYSTEYNRLINLPASYFNVYRKDSIELQTASNIVETYEINGFPYNVYAFGYHGKLNKEFGKPLAEGSLSILLLKEKIKELELVKAFQCEHVSSNYIEIAVGKTNQILSSKNSALLNLFGGDCLTKGFNTEIVREEGCKEIDIAEVLFPPLLARIGINEINDLFNKLKTFLNEKIINVPAPLLTVTDITKEFFELDETGKKPVNKLKKKINNNLKCMTLPINYRTLDLLSIKTVDVPLRFGIEILDRNNLNAIAEKLPKIYAVTWHEGSSDKALHIKYATIVECEEEFGIWAGNYSNNCLIPLK